MMMTLSQFDSLPAGFLEATAAELHNVIPGPSLIHLNGEQQRPLFISVLLHGNETTGFEALQLLLQEFQAKPLPRALTIFVGNVSAAKSGLRVLPDQPDFNRIWPDPMGTPADTGDRNASSMTMDVVNELRKRKVFASIDLHNTSGRNPHHACISNASAQSLQLASLFARQILYFEMPKGVQTMAFDNICPAMTAECGMAGTSDGVSLTAGFLHRVIHVQEFSADFPVENFELYRSVATVKVPSGVGFDFGINEAPLRFLSELDGYNWREISAGTQLAELNGLEGLVLDVRAPDGRDLSDDFLVRDGEKLLTKRSLVPAMLSLDKKIVAQDCLCYFLECVS